MLVCCFILGRRSKCMQYIGGVWRRYEARGVHHYMWVCTPLANQDILVMDYGALPKPIAAEQSSLLHSDSPPPPIGYHSCVAAFLITTTSGLPPTLAITYCLCVITSSRNAVIFFVRSGWRTLYRPYRLSSMDSRYSLNVGCPMDGENIYPHKCNSLTVLMFCIHHCISHIRKENIRDFLVDTFHYAKLKFWYISIKENYLIIFIYF